MGESRSARAGLQARGAPHPAAEEAFADYADNEYVKKERSSGPTAAETAVTR